MSQAVYQPGDLPRRMASKIEADAETGCWLWTGSCNGKGAVRLRPSLLREKDTACPPCGVQVAGR